MEKEEKKINTKKIIKIVIISLLFALIITTIFLYRDNRTVQNFFDENIFRKTRTEESLHSIEISNDAKTHICAYDKNIGILSNNELKTYNAYGKQESTLNITITNPLFAAGGKYLAVAEKNGSKIYLIADKNIAWQADIEGKIESISINKNGYIVVSISQTSYKSVAIAFNPQGREICKTYLSYTYAVDMDISNNNKQLAIATTNLSGIQIKSSIRIIDLEKVEQEVEEPVIYNKQVDANSIITSIKYDETGSLIAMLDSKIIKIADGEEQELWQYDQNTLFADIDLKNRTVQVIAGQSEEGEIEIRVKNNIKEKIRTYIINSVPKEITTKANTIAVNTGSEVYFITSNGFLKTKYQSTQEIKEIVMSEEIAGIVYKNKIEIIKL